MPPNQKELAKFAGVSSGTVSNVINGASGVSERARKKVLAAIKALKYQPNLIARSLRTNRTHTLGMVVPDITIPFFPKLIRGAESAARKAGFFLIVLDSENDQDQEASMLALLYSQRVEGILLVAAGESAKPEAVYGSQITSGPPVVCLDRLPRGLEVDSVCVDDAQASEMAVAHLIGRGHSKIAIITGPLYLQNEQERLRGYRTALQKAKIPIQNSLIWNGGFDEQEITSLCQMGLLRPDRPTAIFATNGVTGLAALRSIYAMGLSTPDDLAYLTFDELTGEDLFRPGISAIVQPAFEIGSRAVEVMLRRIQSGDGEMPLERVRLPAHLRVRESTKKHIGSPEKKMEKVRGGKRSDGSTVRASTNAVTALHNRSSANNKAPRHP